MEELFDRIKKDETWEPQMLCNYSYVDIPKLKEMADKCFDELSLRGDFFHDYNIVLLRIEELDKFIKVQSVKEIKE